jgi:hypothetical protein
MSASIVRQPYERYVNIKYPMGHLNFAFMRVKAIETYTKDGGLYEDLAKKVEYGSR